MDKPISVGDLVMQIAECCGHESEIGDVYRVGQILREWVKCDSCGYEYRGLVAYDVAHPRDQYYGAPPLKWLKRIPPADELGVVEEREEITA